MTTKRMTYEIEHVQTELGQQGFARLILFSEDARGNRERVCHADFGSDYPTRDEIWRKFTRECRWLSYNPHFAKWHTELGMVGYLS